MGPMETVVLEKLAVRLTEKEKQERDLKFMALGTLSGPVVAGTRGVISGPRLADVALLKEMNPLQRAAHLITGGSRMTRWLPASLATGALISGAVPALRRQVEKGVEDKAKARRAEAEGK